MADKTPVILVPMGFSEQSILALDQALIFAKAMKADLTLLSVISDESDIRKTLKIKDSQKDTLREQVKERLEKYAEEYREKSGLNIKTMVANGVVYEEINRVAELIEAEMVIMGTNGKPGNLRRRFIGSNAYRTACTVKVPVITVKGVRQISKINTIIFPLVKDRRSKEKVGPALHYARLFGAKIKIVAVLDGRGDEDHMRRNVNQVEKFISEHGVECTAEIVKAKEKGVVRNSLNYAYENDGDLFMIVEDDRERDITDFFLGTDVQATIYHSEIPVMSITPRDVKWSAMWEGI